MRLDVNGITLNVHVGGDGPPVLLLHGFPTAERVERYATLQIGHSNNFFGGREMSRQLSWYSSSSGSPARRRRR